MCCGTTARFGGGAWGWEGGGAPTAGLQKPEGAEAVQEHFGRSPATLAMVGDRLFTDVAFGNRAGMFTVLTEAFTTAGDQPLARVARTMEGAPHSSPPPLL